MFEFSVASKYLLPRRRQLSVSIISLISVLVISLVVWLIVVFFSVTDGLEKSWIQKLTALTAPVHITPTDAYYKSFYYQIDSISDASGYSHKTIREKLKTPVANPYNPDYDEEIPPYWSAPDVNSDGSVKDLVKLLYASINEIKGVPDLNPQDFELTVTNIKVRLIREAAQGGSFLYPSSTLSYLSYPAFLGNFESDNKKFSQTLLPIRLVDINNLFQLMGINDDPNREDLSGEKVLFKPSILQERLKHFFETVEVTHLKTRSYGWALPRSLLPAEANWQGYAIFQEGRIRYFILPSETSQLKTVEAALNDQGLMAKAGEIHIKGEEITLDLPGEAAQLLKPTTFLMIAGGTQFPAHLNESSLEKAKRLEQLQFDVQLPIQGTSLQGPVFYRGLELGEVQFKKGNPLWVHAQDSSFVLPQDPQVGDGILLPKSFKEAGVLIGDRGYLTYFSPTTSVILEQRLPIYVAGFYDPGIIPIGGKFILANPHVTALIRSAHNQEEKGMTNGINLRFSQNQQADDVKAQLTQRLKEKGISRYWNVETYREYEFTKEIMHELQSQKNIFTLIAIVIIVVACSNIISMLIILVNDKKVEIGILRSMGATSKSIALIFGLAGALIGVTGSLIGIGAAILTLRYLDVLIGLISQIQGHQMLSPSFYGETVPHELSYEALLFVLAATMIISLLAGLVPAVKACLVRPTHILKSTGE